MEFTLHEACAVHEDDLVDKFRHIGIDSNTKYHGNCMLNQHGGGLDISSGLIYWRILGFNVEFIERSKINAMVEAVQVDISSCKPINIRIVEFDDMLHIVIPCRTYMFNIKLHKDKIGMYLPSLQPASFVRRTSVQWTAATNAHIGVIDNCLTVVTILSDQLQILVYERNQTSLNTISGKFDAVCIIDHESIFFTLRTGRIECRDIQGEILHSYLVSNDKISHWELIGKNISVNSLRINISVAYINEETSEIHIQTLEFDKNQRWRAYSVTRRKFDLDSPHWIIKTLQCIFTSPSELILLLLGTENQNDWKVLYTSKDKINEVHMHDYPKIENIDNGCLSLRSLKKAAALAERKSYTSMDKIPLSKLLQTEETILSVKFQKDEWNPVAIIQGMFNGIILLRRGGLSLLIKLCHQQNSVNVSAGPPFQFCKTVTPFPIITPQIQNAETFNCELSRKFIGRTSVFLIKSTKLNFELCSILTRALSTRITCPLKNNILIDNKRIASAKSDQLICDLMPMYFNIFDPVQLANQLVTGEPMIIELLILLNIELADEIIQILVENPDTQVWNPSSFRYLQCIVKLIYNKDVSSAIQFINGQKSDRQYSEKILHLVNCIDVLQEDGLEDTDLLLLHCVDQIPIKFQRMVDFKKARAITSKHWCVQAKLISVIGCPLLKQNLMANFVTELSIEHPHDVLNVLKIEKVRELCSLVISLLEEYGEFISTPALSNVCEELAMIEIENNRPFNALHLYLSHSILISSGACRTSFDTQFLFTEKALSLWNENIANFKDNIFVRINSKRILVTLDNARIRFEILKAVQKLNNFELAGHFKEQNINIILNKLIDGGLITEAVELTKAFKSSDTVELFLRKLLKIMISNQEDQENIQSTDTDPVNGDLSMLEHLVKNVFADYELGVFVLSEFLKAQMNLNCSSVLPQDWVLDLALYENPGATLRLYISYGLLCDASEIAVQFLQRCIENVNPLNQQIAIPLGVLDQLLASLRFQIAAIDENSADPMTTKLLNALITALIEYASKIETISESWKCELVNMADTCM